MGKSRDLVPIHDEVSAISGSFVEKVTDGVEADDPNLDACRVKYIPPTDPFRSIFRMVKMFALGVDSAAVVSETVYPNDAVRVVSTGSSERFAPEKKCVIRENQHGNSPFFEKHVGDESLEFEELIANLKSKKDRAEKEAGIESLGSVEEQDAKRRSGEKPPQLNRGPKRGGSDDDDSSGSPDSLSDL